MKKSQVLLFGTGQMAYEYSKVLKDQGPDFIVVGRGEASAKNFQEKTDITPVPGGADKFLTQSDYSNYKAIIAVNGDQLGKVTAAAIKHGIKSILVEKPGGLDKNEITAVGEIATKYSAKVYIAYNRRFYASVEKAREIIAKDGGILSFHFEFNEVADMIASLNHPKEIKNQWLLHNSSHVIDLAFFLGGIPQSLTANTSGSLPWHPKGAIFTGIGLTKENIPFTYHTNWLAPGRWGLEIMTKNHRLIFRPMEKLQAQQKDSFNVINIQLNDELDTRFKPGLYKEVKSFLTDQDSLCTMDEQINHLDWYNKILEGN